jgi:diguanylate cyclase (GGDEF)-like protein
VAERQLLKLDYEPGPCCVLLFVVEDFDRIARRHGASFGDKLLRVLAHQLRESFPENDTLFRWGVDRFVAIAAGSLPGAITCCRGVCKRFATSNYYTYEMERKQRVTAALGWGAVAYEPGLSVEEIAARLDQSLEDNRRDYLI